MKLIISSIFSILSLGSWAMGQSITPVSVTNIDAVGAESHGNPAYHISAIIDGDTSTASYWAVNPTDVNPTFLSGSQFDLNLGGSYDLTGMQLWNDGGGIHPLATNPDQGLDGFSLSFLDAGNNSVGTFSGNAANAFGQQDFSFTASGVSTVRVTMLSHHIDSINPQQGFNLGEIRFTGQAVPEPSSAFLLALIGSLSVLHRKRVR